MDLSSQGEVELALEEKFGAEVYLQMMTKVCLHYLG